VLRRAVLHRQRALKTGGALTALCALLGAARPAAATLGSPGVAVPVPGFSRPCADSRFPALAGPWIVGCGSDGRVDRALSITSGQELELPVRFVSPGLGEGLVVGVGREAAIVRLTQSGAERLDLPVVRGTPTAPPVTDGQRVAMTQAGSVSAWPLGDRSMTLRPAHPAGWYPPALAGSRLAWVEEEARGQLAVWWLDLDDRQPTGERLAAHASHVVGSAMALAWVDDEQVVVLDLEEQRQTRYGRHTGFSAAPSIWRDVVCWEERPTHPPASEGDGVDIECSDGLAAAGPRHQRWPSRYGPWLLYRQDGALWLATAPAEANASEAPPAGEGADGSR